MKSVAISFVLMLVLCSTTAFAKIWRVNNNNGVTADFTTLQDAHDGAASGDTLHVEGSSLHYGGLNCTKKLIIIGPGYFLAQNQNTQALQLTAMVGYFSLSQGSAGSEIIGLDFQGSTIALYESDITIRRNNFASASGQNSDYSIGYIYLYYQSSNTNMPVTNILISQNYGVSIYSSSASTGVLITNNYLASHSFYGEETNTQPAVNLHPTTIAIIQNNILRRGKVTVHNSTLTNNIMVVGTLDGTGNMMANNLGNATQFGTANGNKSNIDMATVFIGTGEGISADGQWKLKGGSPAIGAGYGSTAQNPIDAGMYSNHTPYMLSGIPAVPSIYFFESQPVGSNTDPIEVTIKVKSNQ